MKAYFKGDKDVFVFEPIPQSKRGRPKKDVPDTNVVMTNADHIRAMTDEELAKWLDEEIGCCCFCLEDERLENEPLLRGEKCDEQCKEHLLDWLKRPYKEDA